MNTSWGSGRTVLEMVRGALGLLSVGFALFGFPAVAQIVPDRTLGTESSRVSPNVNIRGLPGDRIDGGAVRGSSLFHSFSQFNVNNGQRVYFADPAGIANIFSRITGSTASNILGTLGVDGAANLFLLNPNGILFGPNALVDIQGSFVATTGDRFFFPNGAEFGASNPQAPPLLTMSVPVGVQYASQPGNIVNTGNLKVGQDLTLAGGNLDLQGQLHAGRDLTLQAQNTVQAHDSAINPFIASAGGKLVVQGNQAVDIVALSHPNSGLFSGGDMVLRSANTVGGDAHYWSGGNFRIEKLDGNLGNLFSPADPMIRASGDVSFANYEGASLHIFAGGSVTIGDVTITGADTVGNAIAEDVTLSDGKTIVPINGSTQPTLDIRAGTTAIGTPGIIGSTTGFTSGASGTGGTGTSADISINSINSSGGLIFLTNQYQPNFSLSSSNGITIGSIGIFNGGSVVVDSRSGITLNGNVFTFPNSRDGLSGAVALLASGDITLNEGANVDTSAVDETSLGGSVILLSTNGNIILNQNSKFNLQSNSNYTVNSNDTDDSVNSNTLQIEARNGSVFLNKATLMVDNNGSGLAGNILIDARDRIEITNGSAISSNGNVGTISVGTNVTPQTVVINNSKLTTQSVEADQVAGDISIDASDRLEITNNSKISANGNFGRILIGDSTSPQTLIIDNSKLTTNNPGTAEPKKPDQPDQTPGSINIQARQITLDNTATIEANSKSVKGGDITIEGVELLLMRRGSLISADAGRDGSPGKGGNITIQAEDGFAIAVPSENSDIIANAFEGDGGQIIIEANRIFGLKDITDLNLDTNEVRNRKTSDISASSQFGQQGQVALFTLTVDPSQGLGKLPIDVVDPSNLIATGCGPTGGTTANRQSQFVVTGRGGLPPSPNDLQTPGTTSPGWVTRDGGNVSHADVPDQPAATASTDTLVEAQGMVKTAKGELILTAQSPTSTPHQSGLSTQLCVPVSDRR